MILAPAARDGEQGRTLLGDSLCDVDARWEDDKLAVSSIAQTVVAHEFLKHAIHKFAELGSIGVPAISVNPNPSAHQTGDEKHTTVRA